MKIFSCLTGYFAQCGLIAAIAILGGSVASRAANLYIAANGSDGTLCTASAPCYSINHAVWAANPGDTINLQQGTYYYPDGQWIAKDNITVQGDGSGPVILDGSQLTDPDNVHQMLGTSNKNVMIRSLEVRSMNKGEGIAFWNATFSTISYCKIDGCRYSGIYFATDQPYNPQCGNHDNTIDHCTVTNNVLCNNLIRPAYYNGWSSALDLEGVVHATVTNNQIYANYGEGIGCYGFNHTISNNTVHDNFSADIYVQNCQGCTTFANTIVSQYWSAYYRDNHAAWGIAMANELAAPMPFLNNNVIKANVIENESIGLYYWEAQHPNSGFKNTVISYNYIEHCSSDLVELDNLSMTDDTGSQVYGNNFIADWSPYVYLSGNNLWIGANTYRNSP